MNSLATQLEALLFYKGDSMSVKQMAAATDTSEEAVGDALKELSRVLDEGGRGVRLIHEGNTYALGTAPEAADMVEKMRKEEREGPLGKAGLETLAVVIYNHPVSRADIDYIRGVNSSTTLRTLTMRGLIEKVDNPNDKRSYLYQPTVELPAALGVTQIEDMPGFAEMKASIDQALHDKEELEEHDGEA